MRFLKPLFIGCLFFFAGFTSLRAQQLLFAIDSVYHMDTLVPLNAVQIDSPSTGPDSLFIHVRLMNLSGSPVFIGATNFNYLIFINDSTVGKSGVLSTYPAANDSVSSGQTLFFSLYLSNDTGTLPPQIPTGSSVVIWPVYLNLTSDSAKFILNYIGDPLASVNSGTQLYSAIFSNPEFIQINFTVPAQRQLELYDATGRKVYDGQSSSATDEIDWSALPPAVYILRIRQGYQSQSLKLVHL